MLRGAVVCLLIAAAALPSAALARSVYDPDIGWSTARRRALHLPRVHARPCHRPLTRAMIHMQSVVDKRGNPLEAIRAIMHYRWGNAWWDPCDGGRLGIGIQPAGARYVPRVRALLAKRHLTHLTRLFAVRSTYRELSDAEDALLRANESLLGASLITAGIDTTRNTVVVELARPVTPEDRARIRGAALGAPVNVVVHDSQADDFSIDYVR
jgi:hypothetical protein